MTQLATEKETGQETLDPSTFVARALHATQPRDILRNSLEWLCLRHRVDLAAVAYRGDGQQPLIREIWQRPGHSSQSLLPVLEALLVQNAELSQAAGNVLDDTDPERHLVELSAPLFDAEGTPAGVVVLLGETPAATDHALRLAHLASDVALINASVRKPSADACDNSPTDTLQQFSFAAQFESLQEFSYRLAHSLRNRTGCNEVAIARIVRNRADLLCVTGVDSVHPRSAATQALSQAMEECFDLDETIVAQPPGGESSYKAPRLHESLRTQLEDACVVSVPLHAHSTSLVVTFSRITAKPFTPSEIERLETSLQQLAPSVDLVERATRSLSRHLWAKVRSFCTRSSGPRRALKISLAGLLLAAGSWFAFGSIDHQIAVQCRVVSENILHVTAPFDGAILESSVRPNTRVPKGTVLCRFDTTAIELQRAELAAELETIALEVQQHIAMGDTPAARIADARREATQARLDSLVHQQQHSVIVAKDDCYILRGDLSQRIGQVVPQGEALFEIVPATQTSVRLSVEVPEDYALDVTANQPLQFVCNARPDQHLAATIDHVALSASALDGKNAFVAEARVDPDIDASWVRPGMEGTARLNLGERPVRYIALHRLTNWLRRNFWL